MCLAIPGKLIEVVDAAQDIAKVEVAGVRRNVNIGLLAGGHGPHADRVRRLAGGRHAGRRPAAQDLLRRELPITTTFWRRSS